MQAAGKSLVRMKFRPVKLTRGLHGAGGSNTPAGGNVDTLITGPDNSRTFSTGSPEWNAENWRSPTPLFSSSSLLGNGGVSKIAPSVLRGISSKSKKCCKHADDPNHVHDHDHDVPAVLKDDDDDSFDITEHPIWTGGSIDSLLENNKRWVAEKTQEDPDFFKKLASVHKPEHLFIGCSDARLSVQHMLGCEAGELFVHRNVANQVMHNDLNLLTVLTYAVDYLKVKNIIVCGHYDCGGVRAAMKNHDHGLIENWIMAVKDVARLHKKELRALDDDEAIHRRLVELNVQEQCVKLFANPVMQKSQAENGAPFVHAMVFDVGQGLVKELDIDFKSIIRKNRHVYSMYNFDQHPKQ